VVWRTDGSALRNQLEHFIKRYNRAIFPPRSIQPFCTRPPPTMKPQPTFPIPAEITLQTVDSLPGIHEYLDLRDTSVTSRSTCDRVSLATLRRLLDRDLARVRSPHSQVGPGVWLRRLSLRLVEARFPSSAIPNHRVLCDWVTAEGDAQVVENLRAIE
jgi:hypothetical protein